MDINIQNIFAIKFSGIEPMKLFSKYYKNHVTEKN